MRGTHFSSMSTLQYPRWIQESPIVQLRILQSSPAPLSENLNHAFWKIQNMLIPTLIGPDITLGDLTEACQKLTNNSPPWGLLWYSTGVLDWHIWTERNRRHKKQSLRPPETLLKDINISYRRESHRKSFCHLLEIIILWCWQANFLRQRI